MADPVGNVFEFSNAINNNIELPCELYAHYFAVLVRMMTPMMMLRMTKMIVTLPMKVIMMLLLLVHTMITDPTTIMTETDATTRTMPSRGNKLSEAWRVNITYYILHNQMIMIILVIIKL